MYIYIYTIFIIKQQTFHKFHGDSESFYEDKNITVINVINYCQCVIKVFDIHVLNLILFQFHISKVNNS